MYHYHYHQSITAITTIIISFNTKLVEKKTIFKITNILNNFIKESNNL